MHFIDPPFFTADTHFGALESVWFFERPFKDADECDDTMIDNWNSLVSPAHVIYHLGDFGFWRQKDLVPIFNRLNGHKILILGNNDCEKTLRLPWVEVVKSVLITVQGQQLFLSHYPRKSSKRRAGIWYLHGHQHCIGRKPLDVGVDCWGFKPVTFAQIQAVMQSDNPKPPRLRTIKETVYV